MKKTVLITGSNKGIGFETARQLGHKGFHVIISGRDQSKIQKALEKLQEEGIEAEALLMDVSNQEHFESVRRFSKVKSGAGGTYKQCSHFIERGQESVNQFTRDY